MSMFLKRSLIAAVALSLCAGSARAQELTSGQVLAALFRAGDSRPVEIADPSFRTYLSEAGFRADLPGALAAVLTINGPDAPSAAEPQLVIVHHDCAAEDDGFQCDLFLDLAGVEDGDGMESTVIFRFQLEPDPDATAGQVRLADGVTILTAG